MKKKNRSSKFRYRNRRNKKLSYPINSIGGVVRMWDQIENFIGSRALNTQRQYRRVLDQYLNYFNIEKNNAGIEKFIILNVNDAINFVNYLKKQPSQPGRSSKKSNFVSLSTVKHKTTILYTLYKELGMQGLALTNPFYRFIKDFKSIHGNDRRPHKLIPFEYVKALMNYNFGDSQMGKREAVIVALLFGGGLRRSEACDLRLNDIQLQSENTVELILRNTKRQESDTQALPVWASKILIEYKEYRLKEAKEEDPVITNYYERTATNKFVDHKTFYRWFKRILEYVGLQGDYSPHCARHTMITYLLEKGKSHREVAKASRHSSVVMVERYDRMRQENKNDIVKELIYE